MNGMTPEQIGTGILLLVTLLGIFGTIFKAYKEIEGPHKDHEKRLIKLEEQYETLGKEIRELIVELKETNKATNRLVDTISNHETRISILEHDSEKGEK